MARRAIISSNSLKGYLLEEVVAFLISKAGYRLLTDPADDPFDLAMLGNGLQVRGRGGFHQADVLGELSWAPAFGNPIRLFIEAKWRGDGRSKVGIPEVRHAVGILQDVNQLLVTVTPRPHLIDSSLESDDVANDGRGFCYTYRYALCSTSGFTPGAQAYALAHQIALLDLSHQDYEGLRTTIDAVGNELQSEIEESAARQPRNGLTSAIRRSLRERLWLTRGAATHDQFSAILDPIIHAANEISELFVGVSATGFVILLKADHPNRMIRHMQGSEDPSTDIHYRTLEDGSSQWRIRVHSDSARDCNLSFVLPDALLRALDDNADRGRRLATLNFKAQHFSRITVYRITDTKSMICSLKLDHTWLRTARDELEQRRRPRV